MASFNCKSGCLVVDSVRLPHAVVDVLSALRCSFTGWTALGIRLGSTLLLPYHPRFLEVACPSLEEAAAAFSRLGARTWRGRGRITVGWACAPFKTALGALNIYEASPKSSAERCGLGVAEVKDAVMHIKTWGGHKRDLNLPYFKRMLSI